MKQVHWILPFASEDGIRYRLEIYKEGAPVGGVKILTGSASPFVTDDNDSEDYFESTRSQTGFISIVNTDGLVTLEELLPKNNTDRPVRLVSVESGEVKWQGFVKCELLNVDYTSRPHSIELNVMSYVEAMQHMEVSDDLIVSYAEGTETNHIPIRYILYYVLNQFMTDSGTSGWIDGISYPELSRGIFDSRIDPSNFFSKEEISTTGGVYQTASGISIGEVIDRISGYMGWCVLENKRTIYFVPLHGHTGRYKEPLSHFATGIHSGGTQSTTTEKAMSSLSMRDGMPMISVGAPYKAVNVVAYVEDYDNEIGTPTCPIDNDAYATNQTKVEDDNYVFVSFETDFYQTVHCNHMKANLIVDEGYYTLNCGAISSATAKEDYEHSIQYLQDNAVSRRFIDTRRGTFYAGGFHAKIGESSVDPDDGLKINLLPHLYDSSAMGSMPAAVVLSTVMNVSIIEDSYLHINAEIQQWSNQYGYEEGTDTHLVMTLRIGNHYYDYTTGRWSTEKKYFLPRLYSDHKIEKNWTGTMKVEEDDGFFIYMTEELTGRMVLEIYPTTWKQNSGDERHKYFAAELGITNLKVEQLFRNDRRYNDRGENRYRAILDTASSEEYTKEVYIATDMKNKVSPSIIDSRFGYIYKKQSIPYYNEDGSVYEARPELELLRALETRYSKQRRMIELPIASGQFIAPMTILSGYDGRKYLPLSESRDWKTGVSTIRCFEVPEE